MATKLVFRVTENVYDEIDITYKFYSGFAFSQKQKSIVSLHNSIKTKFPNEKILEVSTKSFDEIGKKLSAFNLKLDGKPLECVFQSSKVFYKEGQFEFLINKSPIEAKHFIRDNCKSPLKEFRYNGMSFPIYPKSMFYDYIYIKSLINIPTLSKELIKYNIFTDIEFNSKKSINCQARSCAIYSYLLRNNCVNEYLSDINKFKTLYNKSEISLI